MRINEIFFSHELHELTRIIFPLVVVGVLSNIHENPRKLLLLEFSPTTMRIQIAESFRFWLSLAAGENSSSNNSLFIFRFLALVGCRRELQQQQVSSFN